MLVYRDNESVVVICVVLMERIVNFYGYFIAKIHEIVCTHTAFLLLCVTLGIPSILSTILMFL